MSGLLFKERKLQISLNQFTLPEKNAVDPGTRKKKVIVISGPTAVGKTSLSLMIARALGGQIISADSMQVYRGMDIGTAKATLEERREIPHHLIDSREIDEPFNVMEFFNDASQSLKEVFDKGAVPIVVGGTGFYIHSLIYGPPSGPSSDPHLRATLEKEMNDLGVEKMYARVLERDPEYAKTISCGDRHKIIRALEIMTLTQKKVSELKSILPDAYDFRCWFLSYPKELLYPRIEVRCEKMLEEGLVDEVKQLISQGLEDNPIACQAIGYRQCLDYLHSPQSEGDWKQFLTAFKQASRRYAKRQFTWFRKEPLFRWLNLETLPMETCAEIIIQDYEQR